jgi:hypothetical protein
LAIVDLGKLQKGDPRFFQRGEAEAKSISPNKASGLVARACFQPVQNAPLDVTRLSPRS